MNRKIIQIRDDIQDAYESILITAKSLRPNMMVNWREYRDIDWVSISSVTSKVLFQMDYLLNNINSLHNIEKDKILNSINSLINGPVEAEQGRRRTAIIELCTKILENAGHQYFIPAAFIAARFSNGGEQYDRLLGLKKAYGMSVVSTVIQNALNMRFMDPPKYIPEMIDAYYENNSTHLSIVVDGPIHLSEFYQDGHNPDLKSNDESWKGNRNSENSGTFNRGGNDWSDYNTNNNQRTGSSYYDPETTVESMRVKQMQTLIVEIQPSIKNIATLYNNYLDAKDKSSFKKAYYAMLKLVHEDRLDQRYKSEKMKNIKQKALEFGKLFSTDANERIKQFSEHK
jgi:hypothetical protein